MPRTKNWRRSEARRSVLERCGYLQTRLTPESTPNVMQASESVMTEGLFEARPVSVQANTKNKHSQLKMKNKDSETNLQNKDKNKDNQTDLQNKDKNKDNQTYLQNKDKNRESQTNLQKKDGNKDSQKKLQNQDCQMNSENTDNNTFLHSSGTSTLTDILTKSKDPSLTEYENGSQPFPPISFLKLSNVESTKSTSIITPVTDSILPRSSNFFFESLKPFNSQLFICGSFHQGSNRFSLESRGSQCVSNAVCALVHAQLSNACSSIDLDQILIEGDILYLKTLSLLKAEQKYTSRLLTFDEIPENVNVFKRDVRIMKSDIVSGIAVQEFGNMSSPTLHESMCTAFQSSSNVLVMIGAICSAVYKKDDTYNFFDSHSHGQNGLSSYNGYSVLMRFTCLDDLVTYMYALYDSMHINMTTQYDLLPVALTVTENFQTSIDQIDSVISSEKVPIAESNNSGPSSNSSAVDRTLQYFLPETKSGSEDRVTDNSKSLLENYFQDQSIKRQKKADDIAFEINMKKKLCDNKRKKKRTEYFAAVKRKQRSNLAFKEKEKIYQLTSKQSARKNVDVLAKERVKKQCERKKPGVLAKECAQKQSARKKPGVLAQECAKKQLTRQNPAFKEKEKVYELASKQSARKKPGVLAQECAKKQSTRQNPAFKEKEKVYELTSKQSARKKPGILAQECAQKQSARQNPAFRKKERVYELASKQSARNKTGVLAQECAQKQSVRQNPAFREKEKVYELASKQSARKKNRCISKRNCTEAVK